MKHLSELQTQLKEKAKPVSANTAVFFKTKPGSYAAHDQFMNIAVPDLRKFAKQYRFLTQCELQQLLESSFNEERLIALFILVDQYKRADATVKNELYHFYLNNIKQVNNWNLVDASAHLIMGAHLLYADKSILIDMAHSNVLWERRIAIVATWYFIRANELEWTTKIAQILRSDKQDLIHKAAGWMLREAGKKDQEVLIVFLNQYAHLMPRTMLRYAIEKLLPAERTVYLIQKSAV